MRTVTIQYIVKRSLTRDFQLLVISQISFSRGPENRIGAVSNLSENSPSCSGKLGYAGPVRTSLTPSHRIRRLKGVMGLNSKDQNFSLVAGEKVPKVRRNSQEDTKITVFSPTSSYKQRNRRPTYYTA